MKKGKSLKRNRATIFSLSWKCQAEYSEKMIWVVGIFTVLLLTGFTTTASKTAGKLVCQLQPHDELRLLQDGEVALIDSDMQSAKQSFTKGLQLVSVRDNLQCAGIFLANLGFVQERLSQYSDAREYFEQAKVLARKWGDATMEAKALTGLGMVAWGIGEYSGARAYHEQALVLAQEIDALKIQAKVLTNLGMALWSLGDNESARTHHERAIMLAGELGEKSTEAQALSNLGTVLSSIGNLEPARSKYEQAKVLARELRDEATEAKALNGLGVIDRKMGKYTGALAYQEQALLLAREVDDRATEGKILTNMGIVFQSLGEYPKAKAHHEEALVIVHEIGDQRGEARVLHNLGNVAWGLGAYEEARDRYERALFINRKIGDRGGEAKNLDNLGNVSWKLEYYETARRWYEQALALDRKLNNRLGEASALTHLALVSESQKQHEAALGYYKEALKILEEINVPEIRWRTLKGLQTNYAALGQVPAAIFFGKEAVNTLQAMRVHQLDLEAGLQQSFLSDKKFVYQELADLLIDEGRLWEAQQVLAMLKEEEYFYFIRRQAEDVSLQTQLTLTTQERDFVTRYQKLSAELVNLGLRRAELLPRFIQDSLSHDEQAEFQRITADLDSMAQAFYVFLRDLEKRFIETPRERDREYLKAELESLGAFQIDLAKLGPDVVALHFLSTNDLLRVIVTSGNPSIPPFHRDSSIGEKELNREIQEYRGILQNPHDDPFSQAQSLYNVLFRHLENDLKQLHAKTLLVYLDGALRYLPLAALHDGTQYVAEQYQVVMLTPAVKQKLDESSAQLWRVAGMGVSLGSENFSPLPAVREELDGIVKEEENEADERGILPGAVFLDHAFTREQFSRVLLLGFPVVHMASHFRFGGGTDEESYFLLGGGARLPLSEFSKQLTYPLGQVELLTLSACETGIGGANQDGREVEGLGALVQRRGAKAVLATLWSVADHSTGQFMQEFYQLRQEKRLTKAEALRRVQEYFIYGESSSDDGRSIFTRAPGSGIPREGNGTFVSPPGAPYSHPYYWAPFILMGNFL